jgi:hypothetical protein
LAALLAGLVAGLVADLVLYELHGQRLEVELDVLTLVNHLTPEYRLDLREHVLGGRGTVLGI